MNGLLILKIWVGIMILILIASFFKMFIEKNLRSLFILMIIGAAYSCTEINENVNTFNELTVIEGDSIAFNVNLIDSSKINVNVNVDNGNNIKIIDSIAQNAKVKECAEVPNTPVIVGVFQPTHDSPYIGKVILGGLPTTMTWTLVRFPDKVIVIGSGNSYTAEGLDSRWASNNGAKCYSTKYSWYVINECGHVSLLSEIVEIKSHE
jgi:hypothetical protein